MLRPTPARWVPLDDMWTLTREWYGDRLAEPFRPKPVDQLQQLLTDVGLTADFWKLQG